MCQALHTLELLYQTFKYDSTEPLGKKPIMPKNKSIGLFDCFNAMPLLTLENGFF